MKRLITILVFPLLCVLLWLLIALWLATIPFVAAAAGMRNANPANGGKS